MSEPVADRAHRRSLDDVGEGRVGVDDEGRGLTHPGPGVRHARMMPATVITGAMGNKPVASIIEEPCGASSFLIAPISARCARQPMPGRSRSTAASIRRLEPAFGKPCSDPHRPALPTTRSPPTRTRGGATGLIGDPKESGERSLNPAETVQHADRIRGQLERFYDFDGPNAAVMVNNYD